MSRERLAPLAFGGLLVGFAAQAPCFAQDGVTLYSARADSVAVTIYPDDLALITETRTVELPASAATLVILDVADTLLPQSAVVNGLGRPLAESNFDFNRLSPQSLLTHAIGQTVTLMRTNTATGAVVRMPATVLAAGEGVVFGTEDGSEALYCSGLPEGIVFEAIPDDLYANPQLSMRLAPGAPGERTIQLSYLAHGFEWAADYVAKLDAGAQSLDLIGWATVTNSSSKVFEQAELQLVAGRLNILAGDEGGSRAEQVDTRSGESQVDARERLAEQSALADAVRLRECFEAEPPEHRPRYRALRTAEPESDAIVVTGARIGREEFGDYHLYRLPWRTDLGARQVKQLKFLEQDDVSIERFYLVFVDGVGRLVVYGGSLDLFVDEAGRSGTLAVPPAVMIRAENTADNGLGEPLPGGTVRVFETYGESSVFVGRSVMGDRPVGAEIELEIANTVGVLLEADFQAGEGRPRRLAAEYRAYNDKSVPIDLEIRHVADDTDFTVEESSHPYSIDGGFAVWRFVVPPGVETLRYRVSDR